MFNRKIDKTEVSEYLKNCNENTKIYLGCDSERFRLGDEWYADYMLCVVIHVNGNSGGKIFGEVHRERIYDNNPRKPGMRLMGEVFKVAELYLELEDVISGYETAIHLDVNPSKSYASNSIMNEALGYIRGVCQIEPEIKPKAWAASTAADRYKSLIG